MIVEIRRVSAIDRRLNFLVLANDFSLSSFHQLIGCLSLWIYQAFRLMISASSSEMRQLSAAASDLIISFSANRNRWVNVSTSRSSSRNSLLSSLALSASQVAPAIQIPREYSFRSIPADVFRRLTGYTARAVFSIRSRTSLGRDSVPLASCSLLFVSMLLSVVNIGRVLSIVLRGYLTCHGVGLPLSDFLHKHRSLWNA